MYSRDGPPRPLEVKLTVWFVDGAATVATPGQNMYPDIEGVTV
jgi:hypothetical protein